MSKAALPSSVVQVTPFFWPHIGGVETHVLELSLSLLEMAGEVRTVNEVGASNEAGKVISPQLTVITTHHDPTLPTHENFNGVTIIRLPVQNMETASFLDKCWYKWQIWSGLFKHRSIFIQANVVHIHDVWWWIWPVLPFIWHKVFITFHGWETLWPIAKTAKLQRWIAARLSRGSMHIGQWIQEFYWDTPRVISYGGVAKRSLIKAESISLPASGKPLRIVFIGRLSYDNELPHYLRLIDLLKQEGLKITVTWVGDGEWRTAAEKVGQVTGWVSDPTLYVDQADFVFATSYLSLWLAQARGKVIVALFSHLLKQRYLETFPGRQQLILTSSVHDATQQIKQLLQEKKLYTQIAQAAVQSAKQHTWFEVALSYIKLWSRS